MKPKPGVSSWSLRARRARASRSELVRELGGKCARCPRTEHLDCDVIVSVGPAHHFMSYPERVRFYWQQHLKGNLQLLCKTCHLAKTTAENSKANGGRPWLTPS